MFVGPLLKRLKRTDSTSVVAALVAVLAGAVVFLVATTVFRYHSVNHDEGVYLLQAAMLLEGQVELQAGELAGAFRPWFFVEDGGRLYPKYTPVPAAMYAVSMALFGEPRVTLAAVAAGNTGLVALLGTLVFDRRVGVVAAVLFAASPLALITSAVFLPYAPTTFLNLCFAVAYLYSIRDGSLVAAGVAGFAIGVAFFARPYTAVLFAAPFIAHALYRVASTLYEQSLRPLPGPIRRHGLTAALGLVFVGVTLAYNLRLTGSALVFPYEVFAPLDGPGFGQREILEHSIEYTPALALRANGYVLWYLATRWFVAGSVGTLLAGAGVVFVARRWLYGERITNSAIERTGGLLLGGLFLTVPAGNVLFWGNYNILATLTDPTDGLISQFGPFYHFDLLVALAIFAAVAVVACWRAVRRVLESRHTNRTARALLVSLVVLAVATVAIANAAAVSEPLDRNGAHADKYDRAYEPIENADFDDALVFVPTPYGNWQNHPFQYLRNDPGLDGSAVYALDRSPAEDFAVIDAYADRNYYRYSYRGEWTPNPDRHVVPALEPLTLAQGESIDGKTVVGVPDRVERARIRVDAGPGTDAGYTVENPDKSLTVPWSLDSEGAKLRHADTGETVSVNDTDTVVMLVTLVEPGGATLTYRQEITVRRDGDGVEVVWPPERSVCTLVTDCGTEGTYIPDDPDAYPDGVFFETRLTNEEG